jgi:hypothetical protein
MTLSIEDFYAAMNMTVMCAEGLRVTCQPYAVNMGEFKLVGDILMLLILVINVCSKNIFLQDIYARKDYLIIYFFIIGPYMQSMKN